MYRFKFVAGGVVVLLVFNLQGIFCSLALWQWLLPNWKLFRLYARWGMHTTNRSALNAQVHSKASHVYDGQQLLLQGWVHLHDAGSPQQDVRIRQI